MHSRQSRKGSCNQVPSLETIFAILVMSACLCSILIAYFSQSEVVHAPKKRIRKPDVLPVKTDKGNVNVPVWSDDTPDSDVTTSKIENEAADSDVFLPWFQPVPNPSISSHDQHPYFKGYIIENTDICENQRVDILIYIHSEVGHFSSRTTLRKTWAGINNFRDIRVKTVFFLGDAARPEDGPGVPLEQSTYNDIVQGDFLDVFKNLGIKAVMVSQWISRHCSQARYVIKADDDMFMDIFRVAEFLIPSIWRSPRTLMCHLQRNGSRLIQRDPQSQWYVPPNLLPNTTHFPTFCSGYAMLMTADVMPTLYQGSFKAPLISVDDAFLFGLSAPVQKPLRYMDISRNLSLQQDSHLKEYGSGLKLTHVACRAKDSSGFWALWNGSLARLTDWGYQHASQQILKQTKST